MVCLVKEDNPPFNRSFLHIGTTSLRPLRCLMVFLLVQQATNTIPPVAMNQRLEEGSTKPKELLRQIGQYLRVIRVKWIAGKLTNAVYLDLKGKRIDDDGGVAIAGALATNTLLTKLTMSACRIGGVGMEALSQALVQNTSLKELYISLIVFGPVGLRSLTNALKLNTGLRTLGLSDCGIGDEGAAALADALTVNTTLQSMYLCANNIGVQGATSLLNTLTDCNTTLTSLEFHNFEGIPWAIRTAIREICHANKDGARLVHAKKRFALGSRYSPEEWQAKVLSKELATNSTLTVLTLTCCNLGDSGSASLAKALLQNTTLEQMWLTCNSIGSAGASSLAWALRTNTSLSLLSLSNNRIGDAGAVAIAMALGQKSLREDLWLDDSISGTVAATETNRMNTCLQPLSTINIDGGNTKAIDGVFAMNKTLAELHLDDNSIGYDGAAAIGRAYVGTDAAKAIADALENNASLRKLDLGHNSICDVGATAMLKALKECNLTIAWLNLDYNADLSPAVRRSIDFLLASRLVLHSLLKRLSKLFNVRVVPLAIQAVQECTRSLQTLDLPLGSAASAGPVFYLVRAALKHSNVIKSTSGARLHRPGTARKRLNEYHVRALTWRAVGETRSFCTGIQSNATEYHIPQEIGCTPGISFFSHTSSQAVGHTSDSADNPSNTAERCFSEESEERDDRWARFSSGEVSLE
jgi:Ran GTPase-activating protein (RanGAP) involved in mRNA processing and transport